MNRAQRRALPTMPAPDVAIAYLHGGDVSASFLMSMLRVFLHETARAGVPPHVIALLAQSGGLVDGRNEAVRYFLDETTAEWLWFVDTDMGFAHDTIERLTRQADRDLRPIVGALTFGQKRGTQDPETQAEHFRIKPILYRWIETDTEAGFQIITDYPRDELVRVDATGAACFVGHRRVYEQVRAQFGDEWFTIVAHPKAKRFSEDLSFFIRLAALEVPVHVDTSVKTSHDKGGIFLTESVWDAQQASELVSAEGG